MRWKLGFLMAVSLILFVGAACARSEPKNQSQFPSFVYASAANLESYRAAVALPQEVMVSIPCYCGCDALPQPHRYLRDCFFEQDGSFSKHAAGCDLCGRIALDVQDAYGKGVALKDIRAMIDSKYAPYGTPTNTPPVTD